MTETCKEGSIVGVHVGGKQVLIKRIENTFLIGIPAVGALVALHHIYENGLSLIDASSFLLFSFLGGIGTTVGLHRLFTHKSFTAHPVVAIVLAALGTMAFQGSIVRWVADHRRHHAHADSGGDVHSPHADPWGNQVSGWKGFCHAHIGWMFDNTATDIQHYGKGLLNDPIIRFFTKTHIIWPLASLLLAYLFGYVLGGSDAAWSSMLIGGFLRTAIFHQATWSVNSFGHTVGSKNFKDNSKSTNSFPLALLTLGEGWHNNHHRHPRSYRQGLHKGEIDVSARFIELLEKFGLAKNLIDNSGVPRK